MPKSGRPLQSVLGSRHPGLPVERPEDYDVTDFISLGTAVVDLLNLRIVAEAADPAQRSEVFNVGSSRSRLKDIANPSEAWTSRGARGPGASGAG